MNNTAKKAVLSQAPALPLSSVQDVIASAEVDTTTHGLLVLKRPPQSLELLRAELLEPQNYDIFAAAIRGVSFEDSIGIIAAKLDIVLDGDYEPAALFELLFNAMRNRRAHGNKPAGMDPALVPVDLVERSGSVSVEFAGKYFNPDLLPIPELDGFSQFMREQGCSICESRQGCWDAKKCLGKSGFEEAVKKAEKEGEVG